MRDMSTSPLSLGESESRKRAFKACDRCKLKKVKCCGSKPCSRCQSDDTVCRYGATSRSDVKPVSAARANQLEHQQTLLIKALRLLWRKYSHCYPAAHGARHEENPSIHDIISSLGLVDNSLDPVNMPDESMSQEDESSSSVSSQDSPHSNASKPHEREVKEETDAALMHLFNHDSQDYQQMSYELPNDLLSGDMNAQVFQMPDLSLFNGFDLNGLAEQAGASLFTTISNRRGYGDMPSLGPLPMFDASKGMNEIAMSQTEQELDAVNAANASQLSLSDCAQAEQQMMQGLRTDDALSQFTTLTPV